MTASPPKAVPPQDTKRLAPHVLAAVLGLASAAFIEAGRLHYMRQQVFEMGSFALLAAPILMGLVAGMVRPHKPIATCLIMLTVAVLCVLPVMGEGAVCMVVVVPLFLVFGLLTAGLTGWVVRSRQRPLGPGALLLLLVPAVASRLDPLFLPAVRPVVAVADSVVIDAPREAVWATLSQLQMPLEKQAPLVLAALLPRPRSLRGDGITPGDQRRVVFDNGTLLATVTRAEPPRRFEVSLQVEDTGREFFDHWAALIDATFVLDEEPGGRTRFSHVTRYRPRVFPRWYFEPFEHYFAGMIQRYLLDELVRQHFTRRSTSPAVAAR